MSLKSSPGWSMRSEATRRAAKVLLVAGSIAYPFVVLAGMWLLKAPPRAISLALLALGAVNLVGRGKVVGVESAARGGKVGIFALPAVVLVLVVLTWITDSAGFVKLYPVAVNLVLLSSFAASLVRGPTMIFRIASRMDKSILEPGERESAEPYCAKVTFIWCCFFAINAAVALATALFADDLTWSLYNGLISYCLIGALLGGEFIVRVLIRKRWGTAR